MNDDNKKYWEDKLKKGLYNSNSVNQGRPHQYEHNHFMLTEMLAQYLIDRDFPDDYPLDEGLPKSD